MPSWQLIVVATCEAFLKPSSANDVERDVRFRGPPRTFISATTAVDIARISHKKRQAIAIYALTCRFLVDLAGRYSNRADLQKLETTRAKIDAGRPSGLPRRRKQQRADHPREPRKIERRLTTTTVEELIQAYRDGTSTAQLAAHYGISKTAVLTMLTNREVPRRYQSMTTADIDHADLLYLAGHSLVSCSKLTGFPASTIRDALRERGTPMRPAGGRRGDTSP
ncbi:hypothetical protein AB0N05_09155 [Nocardia sp. NPDC051030]|uniref:hypothetical protein n=1 Tax=Nocardia sp. NPDC051030 TaxID=3155162 RepID=UPI00344569BC